MLLAETKIDESFPDAHFSVDDYLRWRADTNAHGEGIAAYLRSDLPGSRVKSMDFDEIESLFIELKLNNVKWLIQGIYIDNRICQIKNSRLTFVRLQSDLITTKYDNLLLIGDLNYDLNKTEKSLRNVCDIFDLTSPPLVSQKVLTQVS